MSLSKDIKSIFVMLTCVMMLSSFATFAITTVKAPVSEPIIMWAAIASSPYDGYLYVMYAIRDELIKIGIDMRIVTFDPFTWYDTVWGSKWNVTGDADGVPTTYTYGVDGWDFAFNEASEFSIKLYEWWQNPTSYIWLDSLAYSWMTPPNGYNIMSWTDYKADDYYRLAQTTLDSAKHKYYMGLWQEEFMHNPPAIIMYYADVMTARAAYLDGYDDTAWLYELSQIDINETKFNEVALPARKALGSNTLIYGASEPIWNWFPLGTSTYTEEAVNVLKQGMLYRTSRENLKFPPSGNYTVVPTLAADFPTWLDGPNGPKTVARVPLRQGVTWTDGVPFNATDVAFTYNTIISKSVKGHAYQDYAFLLDRVEVVDEYTVDFIYKAGMGPDYDFAGYMSCGFGLGMLPWHQLKDVDLTKPESRVPFETDPIPDSADNITKGGDHQGLECLGPYVPVEWVSPNYVKLQKRTEYVNAPGWANTLPDNFIVKIIPSDVSRLIALQNLDVDFVDYPTASVATWKSMMTWPTHKVYANSYPSSNPLWMNLRNPVLSNRYVRLAIAHAIPYPKIQSIVYGWGVNQTRPGKSFVFPWQEGFNTELGNYVYDIDKAKAYMNMWRYSQAYTDPTKGPVGDHDFSGYVEIADFPVWAKWFGTHSADWKFTPSNDVDPDNDNNGYVEMKDFSLWASNFGKHYPFPGAW